MSLTDTGITFVDADANIGVRDLQLRLETNHGTRIAVYDTVGNDSASGTVAGLRVRTVCEEPADDTLVIRHTLSNEGPAPVWVRAAATGQFAPQAAVLPGTGNGLGWDLRFAHTDNLRTERYPHCQMEYPYLRMLPVAPTVLGAGEDQAFPALYLRDDRGRHGLIVAAASQELNFTVFAIEKAPFVKDGMFAAFEIRHDFRQAGGLQIDPGASIELDGIYFQITGDIDLNDLYGPYIDFLAARHNFRGPATTLRTEAMHCTWNYGVFADQRQEPLLETARFIAENLPGIRYFLMDAGYLNGKIASTFLDRFYPDPNQHVDAKQFPNGIRGFSDALRDLGLKPGIWWSPTAQVDSDLYRDHPDWFLRREDGGLYLIGEQNGYLDYTNPEALDYLDRTLAVILGEWGMDACKMDFWSQNFEAADARLQDPTKTAVHARRAFFETIRKHLPDDGVFMTCVAVGMGSPFIGQWADTYRNTIDIGIGAWPEQIYNCAWALPTLTLPGNRTFLLNNDSVGANLGAPENENMFRFTWSFMHQGMIETGGRMETWPDIYVDAMRRCTEHVDRGYPVRCVDPQAWTGAPFPQVLVVDYPAGSATRNRGVAKHIALFNWADEGALVGATAEQIGTPGNVTARDFWTDETVTLGAEGIARFLPPRSARLYEITH